MLIEIVRHAVLCDQRRSQTLHLVLCHEWCVLLVVCPVLYVVPTIKVDISNWIWQTNVHWHHLCRRFFFGSWYKQWMIPSNSGMLWKMLQSIFTGFTLLNCCDKTGTTITLCKHSVLAYCVFFLDSNDIVHFYLCNLKLLDEVIYLDCHTIEICLANFLNGWIRRT